jgi:alanine racemase
VDCGFGRYGVGLGEAAPFIRAVAAKPSLKLDGIYTHLPFSDRPGCEWAARQTIAFWDVVAGLGREGIRFDVVQATASPGLLCGFVGDGAVAAGHLLYGMNPLREHSGIETDFSGFRPALRRVVTRLVHRTHGLPGDAAAGYLRHCRGPLGSVPIGLAHGYHPAVGEAFMIVRGARAPVLRVTIESTVLDLADVPDAHAGETVTMLGADGPLEVSLGALADWQSCSALSVIMGLSRALPRCYSGAAT